MTRYLYNNFTLKERLLFIINSFFILSFILFFSNHITFPWPFSYVVFLTVFCQVIFTMVDFYNLKFKISTPQILLRFIISFIILSSFVHLSSFLSTIYISPITYLLTLILVLIPFAIRSIYAISINHFDLYDRVVIVGKHSHGSTNFAKNIVLNSSSVYRLLNIIEVGEELEQNESIINSLLEKKVKKIILALDDRRGIFPTRFLLEAKMQGIEVTDFNDLYEDVTGKIAVEKIRPSYLIFANGFKVTPFKRVMKRLFDLIFSLLLLIITAPICLITALLIKLDSKGPIIYKQLRVGKSGKEYYLYKFRSMSQNAESKSGPVWAQENDPRVTAVGAIIRKLRIDEIPQVLNVLKGDMSFVGPRPERPHFVNELKNQIPYYTQRLVVKPGITGWAAVKYKYGSTVEDAIEKMQYDLYYIKHLSLFLDLSIIFHTIKVVITGKGL